MLQRLYGAAAVAGAMLVIAGATVAAVIIATALTSPARAQPDDAVPWGAPWTAPDGRTVEQLIAAHVLPDPAVTPGVLNPAVSDATKAQTVCKSGWTATVRPPTGWTDKLRNADTPAGRKPRDGELDHLISIEDGGAPADPRNLWWMVYDDLYGARVKDVLETKVKRLYCAGRITLDQARAALSPNWLIGYQTYVGPLPADKPH